MSERITVRQATEKETGVFRLWANAETWNPGKGDHLLFRFASPNGFFVAIANDIDLATQERQANYDPSPEDEELAGVETRNIVGIVVRTEHSPSYSFIGYFIVRPDWRSKGVGRLLFEAAMGKDGLDTVGLDAVPEQVERYERWYQFTTSFLVRRHIGRFDSSAWDKEKADIPASVVAVAASSVSLDDIVSLDADAFGCTIPKRKEFLRRWINRPYPGTNAICLVDSKDNSVIGFIACRPAVNDIRIGPLIAQDSAQAEYLLHEINKVVAAELGAPQTLLLDVPDYNTDSFELLKRLGFTQGFTCYRMYSRKDRDGTPNFTKMVFATTSLEAGP